MEEWLFEVIACPQCKGPLKLQEKALLCPFCLEEYPVVEGVPSLLPSGLRKALHFGLTPKVFYLRERYDWTQDPKGLESIYHQWRKKVTLRLLSKVLRVGDLVLDVGCGTGLITRELRKKRLKVIALDLNPWAVLRCVRDTHFIALQGDAEFLPIRDTTVDLVIVTEVMEHLEAPERAAKEIFRVCKTSGKVIGSSPTTNIIWKLRRFLSLTCPANEPLHRSFSKTEVAHLWQAVGFRLIALWRGCLGLNWFWVAEKP